MLLLRTRTISIDSREKTCRSIFNCNVYNGRNGPGKVCSAAAFAGGERFCKLRSTPLACGWCQVCWLFPDWVRHGPNRCKECIMLDRNLRSVYSNLTKSVHRPQCGLSVATRCRVRQRIRQQELVHLYPCMPHGGRTALQGVFFPCSLEQGTAMKISMLCLAIGQQFY